MNAPLFRPAENTSAFLKMGLLGFQGSGKTKTGTKVAIGLVEFMKKKGIPYATKPALFLDTETGSDWVEPDFKAAGIPLLVAKTRTFSDLLAAVKEAEANGSILIVDSISHFWKELCDSYSAQKAKERRLSTYRLQFQDWAYLKGRWGEFTDAFVNSNVHIILCGRAGYEYDYFQDDDGKKNLEKTGVKMKAEGEMGYEPSLLVYMERHQEMDGNSVAGVYRSATVLKDRSTLLDGKEFRDPDFAAFMPHIERLNLGGKQLGVETSRATTHAIDPRDSRTVQRKIVIDEIGMLMTLHIPGQSAQDKTRKVRLLLDCFNAGWAEIEEVMPLQDLREGFDKLHRELEGKPSKYAALLAGSKEMLDDNLPVAIEAPANTVPTSPKLDGTGTDWTSWAGKLLALTMASKSQDDLNAIVFANAEATKAFEQEDSASYARFAEQLKALQERFAAQAEPKAEQPKAKLSKAKEPVAA
jgi:hypothetical protein